MKKGSKKKKIFNLPDEFEKAIHLHQNGHLEQAKVIYKRIIRKVASHPEALHMLGVLYSQTGNFDKAIELMRKSINSSSPVRPDYLFNLARAYYGGKQFDDAIDTYQKYFNHVSDDPEAFYLMGRVLQDKKDLTQAIVYYKRALEKSPERIDYLNSLGLTFHEQGDFEQALACYEKALRIQPNDFIVLYNLGEAFRKLNKIEQAISCFQQTISLNPSYAKGFNSLGIILKEEGRLDEAAENFNKALAVEPEYVEVHFNLGLVFAEKEQFADAADCFWRALSFKPEYAEAHYYLGLALEKQELFDKAASCFRHAVSFNHEYAEAYYSLGVVLLEQGIVDDAVDSVRNALTVRPEYAEAHYLLGHALASQGLFTEATKSLRLALSLKPDYPDPYVDLGGIYTAQGDLDKARSYCDKALAIEPDHTGGLLLLASLQKGVLGADILLRQENLYLKKELKDKQKIELAFALGKVYEDSGNRDKAFFYLAEGNRLKRKSFEYSLSEDERISSLIKQVYDESYISKHIDEGNQDETPIFILGMPRSGTSLVEQILASHPEVYGAGELSYISESIKKLGGGGHPVRDVIANNSRSDENFHGKLAVEYLKRLRAHSQSARFITDKMPHNFAFIGAICLALPNAKIIRCLRDPMDNCFSIYKHLFGDGEHYYAYDQQELAQYYLMYQDLMRHWYNVFPGRIYDIKYENIISNQEVETRKLLEHCGLAWDDRCLSFYKTKRNVLTLSWTQVRKPIYKDSVLLWKKYEKYLEPLRATLFAENK